MINWRKERQSGPEGYNRETGDGRYILYTGVKYLKVIWEDDMKMGKSMDLKRPMANNIASALVEFFRPSCQAHLQYHPCKCKKPLEREQQQTRRRKLFGHANC